jgi:hypothetical protein
MHAPIAIKINTSQTGMKAIVYGSKNIFFALFCQLLMLIKKILKNEGIYWSVVNGFRTVDQFVYKQ